MLNLHAMMKSSKLGEPARLLVVCALILGCFGTPLEASAQTETETTAQCQLSLTALMDRKIAEQAAKGEDGDKHRLILERAKLRFVEGCNANDKIIANNLAKSASNEQRRAAFCSATFEEKWFGKTRWLKKSQEIDEKKLSYADATTLLASLSNFSNQFLAARSRKSPNLN